MSSNSVADQLKSLGFPQASFATDKDGNLGIIPQAQSEQAASSGYTIHEPAVYMTSPDGKLGLVPRSQSKAALDKGYQVGQPTGNLTPDTSNQSLVLSAADKLGMTTPPSLPTMRKPSPPIAPSARDLANQALASNPKSAHIGVAPAASPNIAPAYVSPKTGETLPPDQMDKYSRPIDADLHPLDAVAQGFGTMLHPVSAFGEDIANDARARSNSTDPSLSQNPGFATLDKNVISPIQEAGGEFVGGFGDPKQAALLAALGGVPALGPAGRLIGYGAGAAMLPDMVGGAAQKVTNAGLANDEGNTREAVKNLAGAGLDTYFASDIGKGMVEGAPQAFKDVKDVGTQAIESRPAQALAKGARAIGDVTKSGANAVQSYWDPEKAMSAEDAATKAFRPRNSKTNWEQEVKSSLPDARRAADSMGIDPNSMTMQDALRSVNQAKKDVWSEYEDNYLAPSQRFSADTSAVADRIRGTITDRMREQKPGLAKSIEKIASSYDGREIPVQQLQDRVSELNNETRAIEARYVTDKRAAKLSPSNAFKFAERDGLRELLNQRIAEIAGEGAGDHAASLRKRYGALTSLEDVISRRIPVAERQAPEGQSKVLAKMFAAGRIARGVFTFNPSDILEGGVSLLSQRRSEMLNDPEFLTQQAFKKTTPSEPGMTPAEYMTEPGAYSPLIPSFLHKALPRPSRPIGVPENPVVDPADNKTYGDSVTGLGANGKGGVMVRPAGLLPPAPEPPNPAAQPQRKALPPMGLFSKYGQKRNVEAVGIPETAEPWAIQQHYESHPDVPGGKVVGVDAKSGLPIVKRGEEPENAPESVLSPSSSEAPDSTKLVQNSQEGAVEPPRRPIPEVNGKPIYEASYDELSKEEEASLGREKQDLVDIFGEEGAKRYRNLERTANGTSSRADAAADEMAQMENGLTKEQQNKLYGIGDTRPSHEDVREYREALGNVDDESPEHLAASLRWAVTRMGEVRDPSEMDPRERVAYAQLRHGAEIASAKGWNPQEILEKAVVAAHGRFSDREDALLMLRPILENIKQSREAAIPEQKQLSAQESPDGFVPGTHAAQAAEVLKSQGMKDVRVSIHSDENQALSDAEQIRNNGKTIVSFHVPGIDSTIQRHAEDLDTPEKVQAVRQEVEQRFAGSPNKTVEGIKSKQSAVPVLQKAIEAQHPVFTTGNQAGPNYSSSDVAELKAKHGISDAPAQMIGGGLPGLLRKSKGSTPEVNQVGSMKVSDIHADPSRFQFKSGTDAEGVGTLLKEQDKFNPALAGVVSVWRDPSNGKTYVINGHHRFELARRTGAQEMNVIHIEANNAAEARAIGALQNISEGRGTPVDAAKFIRDSGVTLDELKQNGISLGEATASKGFALSKLDDSLFAQVAQGTLPVERAVTIAERVPDHAGQRAVAELVEKREKQGKRITNEVLSELIDDALSSDTRTETTADLFGEQQIEKSNAIEKAEVSAYIKQQLAKDKKLFGYVSKDSRAEDLERGGNIIDVKTSKNLSTAAAQGAELFDKLKSRSGPMSDIIRDAANRIANKENENAVKQEAYKNVASEIDSLLGRSEGKNPSRNQVLSGGSKAKRESSVGSSPDKAEYRGTAKRGDPDWAGGGLTDEQLSSWTKSKGLRVEPAGEQGTIFGEPEKMYRISRTGYDGQPERALISERQISKLVEGGNQNLSAAVDRASSNLFSQAPHPVIRAASKSKK